MTSEAKLKEDEKKDWPSCVFYPDEIKCPVRFSMVSSSSMKKIMEPLTPKTPKFDDRTTGMEIGKSMMEGIMKASGMEWSVLAAFCHICPFKFEKERKIMEERVSVPPIPPIKLQECPKCHTKGLFTYCPKCGTKIAK